MDGWMDRGGGFAFFEYGQQSCIKRILERKRNKRRGRGKAQELEKFETCTPTHPHVRDKSDEFGLCL